MYWKQTQSVLLIFVKYFWKMMLILIMGGRRSAGSWEDPSWAPTSYIWSLSAPSHAPSLLHMASAPVPVFYTHIWTWQAIIWWPVPGTMCHALYILKAANKEEDSIHCWSEGFRARRPNSRLTERAHSVSSLTFHSSALFRHTHDVQRLVITKSTPKK